MIAIPALQVFLAPKTSLVIALAADFIANIKLVPDAIKHASWSVLRPLLVGGLLGLPLGQFLLHVPILRSPDERCQLFFSRQCVCY
jgi:hypothetical protein